jgi:uncharacterized RDD family membrane protein YckC
MTRGSSSITSLTCPRCSRANEPGATFCYQCGLPLDQTTGVTQEANWGGDDLAGFWIRFGAILIDMLLLGIFVSYPAYLLLDPLYEDTISNLIALGYLIIAVAIWGRTLGKKATGLKIVRVDGSKVGPGRALARPFAWYLSLLILGIGFFMIAFRSDKRGLHDLICGTVVIRTP